MGGSKMFVEVDKKVTVEGIKKGTVYRIPVKMIQSS
jgi:hypothetical protein